MEFEQKIDCSFDLISYDCKIKPEQPCLADDKDITKSEIISDVSDNDEGIKAETYQEDVKMHFDSVIKREDEKLWTDRAHLDEGYEADNTIIELKLEEQGLIRKPLGMISSKNARVRVE
ncbi:hypothetical protein [Parasitella parasitica]|uniref:Uncharacterized protein n=1 Tax=Parasitella parasitica TaxID=35722 RepID=A0A0B7NAZ7_9FUNG|nr:hypothetical protein [Parasitella parasitica]